MDITSMAKNSSPSAVSALMVLSNSPTFKLLLIEKLILKLPPGLISPTNGPTVINVGSTSTISNCFAEEPILFNGTTKLLSSPINVTSSTAFVFQDSGLRFTRNVHEIVSPGFP